MSLKRRLSWEIEGLKFLLRNVKGEKLLYSFESGFCISDAESTDSAYYLFNDL